MLGNSQPSVEWSDAATVRSCTRFWHFGILAFWHFGILAFWHFGILAFWHFGILAFWHFGILAFWHFGILAFESFSRAEKVYVSPVTDLKGHRRISVNGEHRC